jgi:hypothetical protein
VLGRLDSRNWTLSDVERYLSPAKHEYTLGELRAAAERAGFPLDGIRLRRDRAPQRASLVYLHNGRFGHFNVIRPVGHSGTLVQVLDGDKHARVVDFPTLYSRAEWTGLALVPSRPLQGLWHVMLLAGGIVALGFHKRIGTLVKGKLAQRS